MKIAAVDIGSNAIRLQIINVLKHKGKTKFKKLEFIRFPLRLGKDVFSLGYISNDTILRLYKLMETFKHMMDLYEVDAHIANATSAMSEAKNGKEIVNHVSKNIGIDIKIIKGSVEANILSKAIVPFLNEGNYMHIDVGGGSTELNIYRKKKKLVSKSFEIGTVRKLSSRKKKMVFNEINDWVQENIQKVKGPIKSIGTGGNINKLYKISNNKDNGIFSLTELKGIKAYISEFSYEDRISKLNMNPDRADVIIPAAEIYITIMDMIGSDSMQVPGVGLKDGLLYVLYEKTSKIPLEKLEFVG